MVGTSTTEDETLRARIRARLALAFVLDDLDVPARQARLAAIVGAAEGPTKPLDDDACAALRRAAERVRLPRVVVDALEHAGTPGSDAWRLVRAVAWLEGRAVAHPADVLAVTGLPGPRSRSASAAIEVALDAVRLARVLLERVEAALRSELARTEHATDERGQLLYLDPLGRPTTERSDRKARSTRDGVPLYRPPVALGVDALTAADLWSWHFEHVPHGAQRLHEWVLDPLHRAFDESPRPPCLRPVTVETEILAARLVDLAEIRDLATATRDGLLEVPPLAAHEPLFVLGTDARAIAEAVGAAVAQIGGLLAELEERIAALETAAGTRAPPPAPSALGRTTLADDATPVLFRLVGAPLSARFAAAETLRAALTTGLVPAASELAWPTEALRAPLLEELAGSPLLAACVRQPALLDAALLVVLDFVEAAERTERRARRSLTSLAEVQRRAWPATDEALDAAEVESRKLASDLAAQSLRAMAKQRFSELAKPGPGAERLSHLAHIVLGVRPSALGPLSASEIARVMTAVKLRDRVQGSIQPSTEWRVAVLQHWNASSWPADELAAAWAALVGAARGARCAVYGPGDAMTDVTAESAAVELSTRPYVRRILRPGHGDASSALLDVLDAGRVRRATVFVLGDRQEDVRQVMPDAVALRTRQLHVIALVGGLASASLFPELPERFSR